jgi:hypothetical protein
MKLITESEKRRILKLHESFGYKEILNEMVTPESLKEKYVETGRVSEDTFNEILDISNNKINYAAWLTKMVADKIIKDEDVYKYKEYLNLFNKYKQHFPIKDINQIKNSFELKEFLNLIIKMRERNVNIDNKDNSKNYVSPNDIQHLENVGINYLGIVDKYQVFEVPKELNNNKDAWETYRAILGKCAGREQGAEIDICTIANFDHFNTYTRNGPLFVMFNMSDRQSPYQFSYENNEFMDKNNNPVF